MKNKNYNTWPEKMVYGGEYHAPSNGHRYTLKIYHTKTEGAYGLNYAAILYMDSGHVVGHYKCDPKKIKSYRMTHACREALLQAAPMGLKGAINETVGRPIDLFAVFCGVPLSEVYHAHP